MCWDLDALSVLFESRGDRSTTGSLGQRSALVSNMWRKRKRREREGKRIQPQEHRNAKVIKQSRAKHKKEENF
jgi:hypothetical protein